MSPEEFEKRIKQVKESVKIKSTENSIEKLNSLTALLDTLNRSNQPTAIAKVTNKCLDIVETF
jgi:hypothetical protein